MHCTLCEGVVVACVTGEIDMSNARDLETAILNSTQRESRGLLLDLSETTYIDSAGIQLIFELRERLQARGQRFELVITGSSPVDHALRLAGVKGGVSSAASVDDGLQALLQG